MAAPQSPKQLLLLADHLKLTLLERERAQALHLNDRDHIPSNTTPTTTSPQDSQITRNLEVIRAGLAALRHRQPYSDDPDPALATVREQYDALYTQFHGAPPADAHEHARAPALDEPNDPALKPDFEAAKSLPASTKVSSRRTLGGGAAAAAAKNVRFRDNPTSNSADDDDDPARAALFSSQPYTDDPAPAPAHESLTNTQLHTYHTRVLADQDAQLDTLGASISRQRMLGIQMGSELDEQAELLEDVERGVDRHSSTLERAQRRLGTVARKGRENWNWITIGILIVVLILVIVLLK